MRLPGDDELVAYLDDELSRSRRLEIAELLTQSAELRERLAVIRRGIAAYDYLATEAQPEFPSEDELWDSVGERIAHRAHSTKAATRRLPRRATVASVIAAGFAAMAVVWLGSTPSVSANEVLQRARRAEAVRLREVPSPVLHRRLRITRSEPGGTRKNMQRVDLWTVAGSGQSKVRMEPEASNPVWDELSQVFDRNGMNGSYPLSATLYAEWRGRVHAAGESVRREQMEDGAETYSIRTELSGRERDGEVVESGLVVRASDWQPVIHRLRVRAGGGEIEFEIRSVEYSVIARNALPERYFDPEAGPAAPPPQETAREVPAAIPLAPTVEPPAAPIPMGDEIEALYAIHRAGACDGDGVTVRAAGNGRIEIRGWVSTPERRDQILTATSGIPSVQVDLQVAPKPRPRATESLRALLEPLYREQPAQAEALELSLSSYLALIRSDADALDRMVNGHAGALAQELPPAARKHLQEMLEEHLGALAGNTLQMGKMLAQAAAVEPQPEATAAPPDDWIPAVRSLAGDLRRLCEAGLPEAGTARRLAQMFTGFSERARQNRAAVRQALGETVQRPGNRVTLR